MTTHHHIRRQRWRLNAPDRDNAFSVRALLRQELDTLNAVFERALDAVDTTDEVVHISQLKIHLRINDGSDLAAQLEMVLSRQLAAYMPEQRGRVQEEQTYRLSPAQDRQRGLLDFFRNGNLPWHAFGTDTPGTARALAEEAERWVGEVENAWATLQSAAPPALLAALAFFLRLLNLLSPVAQDRLLAVAKAAPAMPINAPAYAAILGTLQIMAEQNPGIYSQRYLQALTLATLASAALPDSDALFAQIKRDLGSAAARHYRIALAQDTGLFPQRVSSTRQTALKRQRSAESAEDAEPGKFVAGLKTATETALPTLFASLLATNRDAAPGLRVQMAGLVLLHPYLPRLFDACHIEQGAQGGIEPHSLPRAAALLHRLATAREDIHEFELDTIKPLLGLTPATPLLVAPGLLDSADAEECGALLEAAIRHWAVLRSTSSDGLRISFLQRHGLLYDNGGHWQLHIEPEAFDVLLAQLPWSISLIKLPWMTKPIFTDWPTR